MIGLAILSTLLALAVTLVVVFANVVLPKPFQGGRLLQAAWFIACALWLAWWFVAGAHARDLGQWENTNPVIRQWYQGLMQPDVPTASCCGEADAYWCDDYYAREGRAFCRITDDRDDAPLGRPHVDNGTEIEIPNHKLKWDKSNPTGHGVVFLSRGGFVYCYVQAGGV
jgi:hypothetical protein